MPADVITDLTFDHSYDIIRLTELPGNGQHSPIHFPGASRTGGNPDGMLLKFTAANGRQWTGCFSLGHGQFCGVYTLPNPDCVCVIFGGAGYWVNVDEPEKSSDIGVFPIRDVRAVPDAQILLLADFTSLFAFGPDGQLWKHRVCWDDLKIQQIQEGIVRGVGYDPTNRKQSLAEFAVELRTGRVLASPYPDEA